MTCQSLQAQAVVSMVQEIGTHQNDVTLSWMVKQEGVAFYYTTKECSNENMC